MQAACSPLPPADWDAYVGEHAHASAFHAAAAVLVGQQAFRLPVHFITARDGDGRLRGVLPLVEQVLTISRVPQVHTMGLRLKRTADTTFTGTALRYAQSSNAGTTPTDSSFALRARLTQFDINESDVANPLGVVALMGLNRGLMGAADDTLGKITIK